VFSEAFCAAKRPAVWTFESRFSLRPGGTGDRSPAIYRRFGRPSGFASRRGCLKLDLGCYESAVPDRFKVQIFHAPGHITPKRGTQSKDQRHPRSGPPIAFCCLCVLPCKFSWITSVAHARNSGVPPGRRPYGVPEPGDKSPGYWHLSLRD
jgi:hypothetical protein